MNASAMIASRRNAAALSVTVGVLLLVAKFVAYAWTGSAAVLSDALESVVNVVASSLALYTVVQSAKPADEDHPYGHGKAEDFSAGVEGTLIVVAAVSILVYAVRRLLEPVPIENIGLGLIIVVGAGAVNGVVGAFLIRRGRATNSRALVADGHHLIADLITSIGVVVGLLLVWWTGRQWLDSAAAGLVAVNILVSGVKLVRGSVGRLMDEADDDLLAAIANSIQEGRRTEWIDVHQLRAWRAGDQTYVDLHLTIPYYWTVEQAHASQAILSELALAPVEGRGEVIVHLDPCKPQCCAFCQVENCEVRQHKFTIERAWTRDRVVAGPER